MQFFASLDEINRNMDNKKIYIYMYNVYTGADTGGIRGQSPPEPFQGEMPH